MPKHVVNGIKSDGANYSDVRDHVTILYSDIVGFTEFSRNHKPHEVVKLLQRLFAKFDELCE